MNEAGLWRMIDALCCRMDPAPDLKGFSPRNLKYLRRGVDRQQYGEKLLDRLSESLIQQDLSFTHFAELIAVEDDTRRAFEQPLAPGALREASIRPIACGESGSSEGDH